MSCQDPQEHFRKKEIHVNVICFVNLNTIITYWNFRDLSQASEGVRGFLTDLPSDGGSYLLCCQYLPSWLVLLSGHTLVWQAQLIINLKGFFILFFIFSLEIHLCLSPLEIWFSGCGWSQAKSKQDAVEEGSCLEMTASEDSENIIKHNSTF